MSDFIFHGQWELETSLFVVSVSIVWCSKRFRREMWFSASCRSAEKNGFLPLGLNLLSVRIAENDFTVENESHREF